MMGGGGIQSLFHALGRPAALLLFLFVSNLSLPVFANEPKILGARVVKIGKESYAIDVTVAHADDSWDHYLDKWEVVGPGGKVLGTRVLYHPHIGEPHFTRGIGALVIPAGVAHVIIRVHDKVHGYGPEKLIELPTDQKPDTGWK
jgi:hypothetical protein